MRSHNAGLRDRRLRLRRLPLAVVLAAIIGTSAWAEPGFPTKPIRISIPFGAGGVADLTMRLLAQGLTERTKQQVIIENRPGAGGLLGSELASNSAPDGYTLVVSGIASHVIAPALAAKPPFDPVKDFTHIALFGGPPAVFGVHPSLPTKDLKAFVALAKSKPRELTYGSPGNGTQGHLMAELFRQRAGIDIVHIPYKGASIAVVDIVAGHIHAISTTLTTASAQIRAGRVRALAISSESRLSDYPGVPTFRDAGYRDVVGTVWFSLSGPAGMPADVVNRLNGEVRKLLELSDVRDRLRPDGIVPNQLDAKAFTGYMVAELKRWAPIVRASGAGVD